MLRVVCLHNDTPIQKTECAPGPPLVRAAKLTRFGGQICDENRIRIDLTPASKRHHCGAFARKMQRRVLFTRTGIHPRSSPRAGFARKRFRERTSPVDRASKSPQGRSGKAQRSRDNSGNASESLQSTAACGARKSRRDGDQTRCAADNTIAGRNTRRR